MLLIAQCFAIMPLKGLYSDSIKDIKLVLKHPGTLVNVMFLIAGSLHTLAFAQNLLSIGINAKNIGNYYSGKLPFLFKSSLTIQPHVLHSWICVLFMWVDCVCAIPVGC